MTILELKSQCQHELTSIRPSRPSSALKANHFYSPPVSCSACGHSPAWQCHWNWRPSLRNLGTSRVNKGLHPALQFPPSASPSNPFLPSFTSSLVFQSSLISSATFVELYVQKIMQIFRPGSPTGFSLPQSCMITERWRKGHIVYSFTRTAIAW